MLYNKCYLLCNIMCYITYPLYNMLCNMLNIICYIFSYIACYITYNITCYLTCYIICSTTPTFIAHLLPPPRSGAGAGTHKNQPHAAASASSRLQQPAACWQKSAPASAPQLQPQIPFLAGPSRNATSKG